MQAHVELKLREFMSNQADLHARHWSLVQAAEHRERMRAEPEYHDVKFAGWWVWGLCQWIGSGWCDVKDVAHSPSQQLPHLGDAGRGWDVVPYMAALSDRLRNVRVACGDWSRVLGDSVTWRHVNLPTRPRRSRNS